jgi:hypothetical protein
MKQISKKQLDELDDDDIPVVKESTDEGFWGNNTTGHLNDEQQK